MGIRHLWPHNMLGLEGLVGDQAWRGRSTSSYHRQSLRTLRRSGSGSFAPSQAGTYVSLRLIIAQTIRVVLSAKATNALFRPRRSISALNHPKSGYGGAPHRKPRGRNTDHRAPSSVVRHGPRRTPLRLCRMNPSPATGTFLRPASYYAQAQNRREPTPPAGSSIAMLWPTGGGPRFLRRASVCRGGSKHGATNGGGHHVQGNAHSDARSL